jgi:hypothetical protein
MKNVKRFAAATALSTGIGLAGLGAASVAEAIPGPAGPMPAHNWCPGQFWDPGWGNNWDWHNCHGGGPGWRPNGGPGPGPVGPNGMPNGGPGPGPFVPNGPGGWNGGHGGGPGGWNGGHGGH